MNYSFKGKNVIITGAKRGIGRVILERMATAGANIWACDLSSDETFEAEMKEIALKNNVWIRPVYFNLADSSEVDKSVRGIIAEKKSIDILINNAGIAHGALMIMTPMSKLKDVFQINYFSQIQIIQLVSRIMMRQKSGTIVNMASVGGIESTAGYLAYGSSKSALIYATKCISHELGEYGIRINAVAPGLVATAMGQYKSEIEIEKILNRSSMHRFGEPNEIANCVMFLASEESSFITGQVIIADGGRICV